MLDVVAVHWPYVFRRPGLLLLLLGLGGMGEMRKALSDRISWLGFRDGASMRRSKRQRRLARRLEGLRLGVKTGRRSLTVVDATGLVRSEWLRVCILLARFVAHVSSRKGLSVVT